MRLKHVVMNNIRSYVDARVEFSDGSTLLAGDVGAGKSSVLLATEFALFGIQRGQLDGGDLLRHGASRGFAEMCFDISDKTVKIRRGLSREKRGVVQDECSIEIDGILRKKTAQEIRAEVLQLLGYPMEYVTKNPLVFRYTVYTPQDEMKRILFAPAEERLSIIRKILGVDKYGRIAANASLLARELRARKRELEAFSKDADAKESEIRKKESELESMAGELSEGKGLAGRLEAEYAAAEEESRQISHEMRGLEVLARSMEGKKSKLQETGKRNLRIAGDVKILSQRVAQLESEASLLPRKPTEKSESELSAERRSVQQAKDELTRRQAELESELRRLKAIMERGHCEFCDQDVADRESYSAKVEEKKKAGESAALELGSLRLKLDALEDELEALRAYSSKLVVYQTTQKRKEEARESWERLNTESASNDSLISQLRQEIEQLSETLGRLPGLEEKEHQARKRMEDIQKRKLDAEKKLAWIESAMQSAAREISRLREEVEKKRESREKAVKVSDFVNWMEQSFVVLMQSMERAVLASVQKEFNGYFQTWFGTLMGTENMSVSIDEQFAPSIEQEGYQTDYANLSGGEKTAVALAYRLALNKVINSMIETIRTKDMIILDEPTDGFSGDQIDRIRDVLAQLGLKQMLIVSHEQKIDTFVDHVIRFYKEGHVSKVAG